MSKLINLFVCQLCGYTCKSFATLLTHYDLVHRGQRK